MTTNPGPVATGHNEPPVAQKEIKASDIFGLTQSTVTGFFDTIDGQDALGWCYDQNNPSRTVKVDILCDGVVVARGNADIFREDLAKAGIGNGCHHFRIKLPKRLFDGQARSISVRESGGTKELFNSPKVLENQKNFERPQVINEQEAARLLAEAQSYRTEKLWAKAESATRQAISFNPNSANAYWTLGQVVEKLGRLWEAVDSYRKAISLDPRHSSWHFTYGLALEKRNELSLAADAYRKSIELKGDISERHYRLGYVLERLGDLEEAEVAYDYAMELDTSGLGSTYGIGAYHAERGMWSHAIDAYKKLIERNVKNAELYYRIGMSYENLYAWPEARDAYREALSLDGTDPTWHFRMGLILERLNAWEEAAQAYSAAVSRSEHHQPKWYYRLGFTLDNAGQRDAACAAFRQMQPIGRSQDLYPNYADKDKGFKIVSEYTEYYETLEIVDQTILYESFHGASISCNPYAIFLHLLESPQFLDWTHIWVINDKNRIPSWLKSFQNVIFVSRGSDLYLRYLTTAKYLINNTTFPEYFIRKPDQIYLNTWHGTPWKTLGKDNRGQFFEHKNATRNFLHASHMISPNRYTTDILIDRYDIRDVYQGLMVETGYPRVDLTLRMSSERQHELRKELGLSKNDKVILYAPTWRGTQGGVKFDCDRLISDLKRMNEMDGTVIFRGHHLMEKLLKDSNLETPIVPAHVDTNELLGIVDVLITDYSSIFFDFLPTEKPIIHYIYDYDQYAAERGLYLPLEDIPGQLCKDIIGVKLAVRKALAPDWAPSARYLAAKKQFCPVDDGAATERVINLIFNGIYEDDASVQSTAKPILFFAGALIPNGITTSFINLVQNLDKERYRPVLILDPANTGNYPERLEQFSKIKDEIQTLGRAGRMNLTAEERFMIDVFVQKYRVPNDEAWDVCARAYKREFIRTFGYTKFECMINFEGYSQFWTAVFAFAPEASTSHRSIYAHSDMQGEWRVRFAYLESIFQLYGEYNKVVSVTESINQQNQSNLSSTYSIDSGNFNFCENSLSPQKIRALAEEELPATAPLWLGDPKYHVFAGMGRLSPEKDHRKLIAAFSEIHHLNENARLLIIGDGPLRHELETEIADFGMSDVVMLAGQHVNPFPMLKAADCFVLSSNHEGQGMVLLEALTLGVPAISTDIPGPRSVLKDGKGLLVDNSVAGLVEGMSRYLEGEFKFNGFNAEQYQQQSIEMFYHNVCNIH